MRDHLLDWIRVREEVRWAEAARPGPGPVRGARDGVVEHVRTTVARRDPERARRLLAALRQARTATELTPEALAGWQAEVLGTAGPAPFRSTAAFAKRGRERYGLHPDTGHRFRACLAEASGGAPLPARAARVYLDVAFFHPFEDGNARAAMLCLYHVLHRGQVTLDQAGPLLRVTRRADDPAGAADLVRLVDVLIAATRRRAGT
jgi:hypothetical protein